jgi:glutamate racemase
VGGLSVSREIFRQLPAESTIYYGDTAHVPYGPRTPAELVGFAENIITFLVERGAKYVIFACNTSSSLSLHLVREKFTVPMIGLISPGAAEALRKSKSLRVGVLATEATVRSGAYRRALEGLAPGVKVFSQAAPRLVPLVESGLAGTAAAREAVRQYLRPLQRENIDTLILGCTHYPFLEEEIREGLGAGVAIVDPAAATVRAAAEDLSHRGLLAGPDECRAGHHYYVSGDPARFQQEAKRFLGYSLPPVRKV